MVRKNTNNIRFFACSEVRVVISVAEKEHF
jgi:hypothetical protein